MEPRRSQLAFARQLVCDRRVPTLPEDESEERLMVLAERVKRCERPEEPELVDLINYLMNCPPREEATR